MSSLASGSGAPPRPHRSSTTSSSYLLLTHERSPLLSSPSAPLSPPLPLPRPRFLWVLQLACALDLVSTLGYGATLPLNSLPRSAVGLSVLRPVFVAAVVSSRRVRAMGPLMLAQLAVSFLVLLFRLNELVQRSSSLSLPPTSLSSSALGLHWHPHLPPLAHLLNPTSRWYLLSFSFSLAHYALFALVVGVRRRRNPFAGGGGGGVRRSGMWGEQEWQGREEEVGGTLRRGARSRVTSRASQAILDRELDVEGTDAEVDAGNTPDEERGDLDAEEVAEERAEEEDDALSLSSHSSSSEDEDDIIDIPRSGSGGGAGGTLRHRPSRASFLSARGGGGERERGASLPSGGGETELQSRPAGPGPGIRGSKAFGSMRSLAGI
ncbi:hypothetical protein JCM10207_008050 [Rhodosporidiobolus poonsookiae]